VATNEDIKLALDTRPNIRHAQWPVSGRSYPKIQIITVPDLFAWKAVDMPTPLLPYIKAPTFAGHQLSFDET